MDASPARIATMRSSAERDAAVRRRPVLERFEEEAEAQLRLLVADAEPLEDARLQRRRRGSGCCRRRSRCRSAPGRRPSRAPLPGSLLELLDVLVERRRERMVHRSTSAVVFRVPLEQREVRDPRGTRTRPGLAGSPSSRAPAAAARAASTWPSGAAGHQRAGRRVAAPRARRAPARSVASLERLRPS